MSASSYRVFGVDKQGTAFHSGSSPMGPARKQYYSENAAASSVITVTDNTTVLEISAGGSPVALRWVPRTETAGVSPFGSVITATGATANFDAVVQANATRVFPIPQEISGTSSIVGLNIQAGLYNRVALKNFSTGSVISVEL